MGLQNIFDFFDARIPMNAIVEMERRIFEAVDFNLCRLTTLDFLPFYFSQGMFWEA